MVVAIIAVVLSLFLYSTKHVENEEQQMIKMAHVLDEKIVFDAIALLESKLESAKENNDTKSVSELKMAITGLRYYARWHGDKSTTSTAAQSPDEIISTLDAEIQSAKDRNDEELACELIMARDALSYCGLDSDTSHIDIFKEKLQNGLKMKELHKEMQAAQAQNDTARVQSLKEQLLQLKAMMDADDYMHHDNDRHHHAAHE